MVYMSSTYEHPPVRLLCGCPLDSGCDGYHSLWDASGERSIEAPADPSPPQVRCGYCRRLIHKQRNGAWYHNHNASEFCKPGVGTGRKAFPRGVAS
jgi:hypothetical protein